MPCCSATGFDYLSVMRFTPRCRFKSCQVVVLIHIGFSPFAFTHFYSTVGYVCSLVILHVFHTRHSIKGLKTDHTQDKPSFHFLLLRKISSFSP